MPCSRNHLSDKTGGRMRPPLFFAEKTLEKRTALLSLLVFNIIGRCSFPYFVTLYLNKNGETKALSVKIIVVYVQH
ncbi:hypothetical protein [Avibacterium paragallinarum]|uniref:hypothetical protein n=1 Tax=Avibacterium paragallinarum TaxID=728 RepID=UPI00397DFCE2